MGAHNMRICAQCAPRRAQKNFVICDKIIMICHRTSKVLIAESTRWSKEGSCAAS